MTIDPVFSPWLLISLLSLLTIFFLWLELRRRLKFIVWRCTAVCLSMIAVAAICLRPGYSVSVTTNILLLTPDYNPSVVDSLLRARPELVTRQIDGATSYKNSQLLTATDLEASKQQIAIIAGEGLPTYALDGVGEFQYYGPDSRAGITLLNTPNDIRVNRGHTISGAYNKTSGGKVTFYLESPAGKEDSVDLTSMENIFSLSFTPKQNGKIRYRLTVLDSGKTYTEPIPIYVNPPSPLNILIIQGYPTFEVRYLKNFLQRRNHSMAIRYQLSKQIFRYEFVNRKPTALGRISPDLLSQYDLLIVDNEAINNLSPGERSVIRTSIDAGFGVLMLLNKVPQGGLTKDIFPFGVTSARRDSAVIKIGSTSYTFPALPIRPRPNPEMIEVTSNASGTLSGYFRARKGHIAFQLLQETYRLVLSGDSLAYGKLWSPLIEQVAKARGSRSAISIGNQFPFYIDEPVSVRVISRDASPRLMADSLAVALIEDPLIDGVWTTTIWHRISGWHTLATAAGDSLNYYVPQNTEWLSLKKARQLLSNRRASNHEQDESQVRTYAEKKYPPIIFYLIFVSATGFLWLAPKL
ncbi:MAG: hypothetical protein WKF87_07630 [Chryseolinea sp.]